MGDRKRQVAAILGPKEKEPEAKPAGDDSLLNCAQEALEAIHAKDAQGFLESMRTIFAELDREPHEEGPHTEDDGG